jgi:hypothetical protein
MTDLIACDSTRPRLIPGNAWGILPYPDGEFEWPASELERFPHAHRRFISALGDYRLASIGDVERGAMTPEQAPGFIHGRTRLYGDVAAIYCNLSTLPAVEAACKGLVFDRFIADWTGEPHWLADVDRLVAVQFAGGVTAPFDRTLCKAGWMHPAGR